MDRTDQGQDQASAIRHDRPRDGRMAEDDLDIADVEHAVLTGRVVHIQRRDPRGNKYVLEGTATDGTTLVGVVGRFPGGDRYLVVTVYKVT